ncbi:MAG TPA: class E sortase [Solirubrobacteraceae bacterium]|nr:class E sortase [Solirubrobacteraceae bacterium]
MRGQVVIASPPENSRQRILARPDEVRPLVLTGNVSPLTSGFTRRRLLRDTAWVLITVGLLLALDAAMTLLWQEPVTAVIALVQRGSIDQQELSIPLTGLDRHALASLTTVQERIAFLARREQQALRTGAAIGRIEIPRLGTSFEVVQGTDAGSLQLGPGHYPGTALPGLGDTVAIAGHRTTYLEPFRDINQLGAGDAVILRMPYATFTYVVQSSRIVTPTADWVLDDVGYDRLVLSACNPLYSAAQRIIVFARLQEVSPAPSARAVV